MTSRLIADLSLVALGFLILIAGIITPNTPTALGLILVASGVFFTVLLAGVSRTRRD